MTAHGLGEFMRRYRIAALAFALALACGGAAANETPSHQVASGNGGLVEPFNVGGADFVFPVPPSYCLPTGRYESLAKVAAQMDSRNLTLVSFVSCTDMQKGVDQTRWGMIKALIATLSGGAGPRADLINTLKSQINPADLEELNKKGADEVAGNIERGLGQKLDIKADIKTLEADDAAAYSGGTLTFGTADGKTVPISCVYSVTVLKDRVFFLYFFSVNTGAHEVTTLLAELKLATHAFVAANPEGK